MKSTMKNCAKWIMPLSLGLVMMACSDDEETPKEGYSQVTLKSTAEGNSESTSENNRVDVSGMSITSFQVGTRDMEMKYVSQAGIDAGISIGNGILETNISAELGSQVSQEKSLTLVADGESQVSVIGEGETPNGSYTEVIFKLYQHSEASAESEMKDKSMLIQGEVEGKSTQVWFAAEKQLRAVAESSQGYEVNGNTDMTVVFDLEAMFAGVEMDAALDANADGVVEIGPDNVDGNAALYSKIESNIESAIVLKNQ
ncbi:hypothetical protein FKX85_06840 [Echinicola soli]|uniref:Lipoprotein n=1 Tax=Echinicola soli TaxID=2591634 RepID=A0A514CG13_9BACT|nr:hypothetical protein [Echinicola soli]QDH78765.1 hypothetical protein FKX85_06840 [Echinicola soli]